MWATRAGVPADVAGYDAETLPVTDTEPDCAGVGAWRDYCHTADVSLLRRRSSVA